MKKMGAVILSVMLIAGGCTTTRGNLTERESGGILGAGIGAGTGAIIGSATGTAAIGVAIGTPIGLLVGALIGEAMRLQKESLRNEIRQEQARQMQQGEYHPTVDDVVSGRVYTQEISKQEIQIKYNPKTGHTFPAKYQVDPITGDKLEFVKAA